MSTKCRDCLKEKELVEDTNLCAECFEARRNGIPIPVDINEEISKAEAGK